MTVLHASEFVALNDAQGPYNAVLCEFRYEHAGRVWQAVRSLPLGDADMVPTDLLDELVGEAESFGRVYGVTVQMRLTGERSRKRGSRDFAPVPAFADDTPDVA